MLYNPYLLREIIWGIHCVTDDGGWPRPCTRKKKGREMLAVALRSPSMAQTPVEGSWWGSGEGYGIDRMLGAGGAFEEEVDQKWEEGCTENLGYWAAQGFVIPAFRSQNSIILPCVKSPSLEILPREWKTRWGTDRPEPFYFNYERCNKIM